jgi:predicted metal-dependent phosphoesterase TrpH
MVTADLHIHTYFSSDSIIYPDKLLKKALKENIDIVCITDHNVFEESSALDTFINSSKKPLFIKGVELTTNNGDILIFGLKKNFWLDFKDKIRPDIIKVLKEVKLFNGVAIWAHPFRAYTEHCYNTSYKDYDDFKILEGINGRNLKTENINALNYAKNNNYKTIGSSDAHTISNIASAITLFKDKISNELELIDALKNKTYKPLTYNEYKTFDLNNIF